MLKADFLHRVNLPAVLIVPLFIALFYHADPDSAKISPSAAGRIVSLSPSITREIIDLECGDRVIGITTYDDAPRENRVLVGSIIQPDIETIAALRPDAVLFSMEDNPTQHTERLSATGIPSLTFRLNTGYAAITENYRTLARLLGKEKPCEKKLSRYAAEISGYTTAPGQKQRVAVFVSHHPLIAASASSFIGRIVGDAGGVNFLGEGFAPFTPVSAEFIVVRDPEVIISIMPDAAAFFSELLHDFPQVRAAKSGRIHYLKPDHLCYYTPKDYAASLRELAPIINERRERP